MNRLLRIGFDTLLTSVTPILGWFLLGILLDKNLINTFSLMYPIQFIISMIRSIFGIGANISTVRDNNKNSIFSGIVIGSIIGATVLGIIILNIDNYITFMSMDTKIYKTFAIYAIIQMFLQLLLNLSLCKLYYENNNKKANRYSMCFNIINFLSLIIMSIITKNQIVIACVSIFSTSIFVIFMMFKIVKKTKIQINILNCIKYDSVYLFGELSLLIVFLFGFKNVFNFGEKYILATSFSTLITVTQWDILGAVKTVSQIDIAKRNFSYKTHIKNSRKLVYMLISSTFIMEIILQPIYKSDIFVTSIIVCIELISMYIYPIYITKLTYIQLEYSAVKATVNKQIANLFRILCSFIPSPFCTSIGLAISAISQLLFTEYIIKKNRLNLDIPHKSG